MHAKACCLVEDDARGIKFFLPFFVNEEDERGITSKSLREFSFSSTTEDTSHTTKVHWARRVCWSAVLDRVRVSHCCSRGTSVCVCEGDRLSRIYYTFSSSCCSWSFLDRQTWAKKQWYDGEWRSSFCTWWWKEKRERERDERTFHWQANQFSLRQTSHSFFFFFFFLVLYSLLPTCCCCSSGTGFMAEYSCLSLSFSYSLSRPLPSLTCENILLETVFSKDCWQKIKKGKRMSAQGKRRRNLL